MFSSLAIANYRKFFTGALLSNIGTWMSRTAVGWLVLVELTDNSASALGLVTAIMFLPQLILGPYAGTVADRFPKRRIMLTTQSVLAIDALILSTLVLTGVVELWMVYVICAMDGLAQAFDQPARQAIVFELVGLTALPNAIGLNSASYNTARLIGPGIGGLVIAWVGTGYAFLVDGFSYLAMLIAVASFNVAAMHVSAPPKDRGRIIDGFRYIAGRFDLLILIGCGFAVGGLAFNFNISNIVMATDYYHRSASEYGILGSMMGLGALGAALWAARRTQPRLRHIFAGMIGYIVFNLAAAFSPWFELFVVLQIPVGLATITVMVTGNTLVQSGTDPDYQGRVMSMWGLCIMGVAPIVSPIVGWLGDTLGPQATILFGVVCVAIALVLIVAALVRHDHLRVEFRLHPISVHIVHSAAPAAATPLPEHISPPR